MATAGGSRPGVADGAVHFMHNQTRSPHRWIAVQLPDQESEASETSEVEIKAGAIIRSKRIRCPLLFEWGVYGVDTVRITWSNGLIQNETKQATNRVHIQGGARFWFVSDDLDLNGRVRVHQDVLGVARLALAMGRARSFGGSR